MTRTRRTPAQIAADLADKAAAAAIRADIAAVSTDPKLAPLVEGIKTTQTKVNQLRRKFADTNPESFDNRIKAFNLRIAEANAGAMLAAAQLADAENTVKALKTDLESFSSALAAGEAIDEDLAQVAGSYSLASFPDLEKAFEIAHLARKAFKGSILADKDEPMADAAPAEVSAQ
jgi:hypothetical protein